MVKSIKAYCGDNQWGTRLYYGVQDEAPLRKDNLISVILYTDFTELSSDFTSTFRKKSPFETLGSIKTRNSRYWWMSKTLRETVELYGIWREKEMGNRIESLIGPFYTGMSFIMNIPQFSMRLCSPTSTSMQIQVAMKFSGNNGIIFQLNTNNIYGDGLAAFDVSWLSRYKEEDERYYLYNFDILLNDSFFFVLFFFVYI